MRGYTRYGTVTLIKGNHTHTQTSTVTLKQTQTLLVCHTYTLKYDRNTLGIYSTTALGLIRYQNGAKRVSQDKNLLKVGIIRCGPHHVL